MALGHGEIGRFRRTGEKSVPSRTARWEEWCQARGLGEEVQWWDSGFLGHVPGTLLWWPGCPPPSGWAKLELLTHVHSW